VALISPHAGYEFSGAVAAHAYALVKGRKFERVVVIAPSHIEAFGFSSVYDGDAYATPLGLVPVDKEFAAKLAGMSSRIKLSSLGHVAKGERGEHALEDELPFLQRALGGPFKLVPIIVGDQSYDNCRALGLALAKLIGGSDTLIVASSDLSHYHPYAEAAMIDRKTLKAIQEWDYLSMARNFETRVWEACGGGPIIAAMIASERLGATEAKLLKYANSGDVTGDRSSVVGYGALALIKANGGHASAAPFTLTKAERDQLLKVAKASVEAAVRDHRAYDVGGGLPAALMQERGAFVTLKEKGELRGCIGYIAPMKPLSVTVRDVASFAALRDTRFSPVEPAELSQLQYEVSVLSPLRRVLDVKEIEVGKHGLVMRHGDQEGLLLPQVPVEEKWNRLTFLEQTCRKAGLPADAWKDPDTDIFMFTALVFGDH
jgi:AmmeMemoRadiSam system protein B/AmmeMemoRadiSam system protein A